MRKHPASPKLLAPTRAAAIFSPHARDRCFPPLTSRRSSTRFSSLSFSRETNDPPPVRLLSIPEPPIRLATFHFTRPDDLSLDALRRRKKRRFRAHRSAANFSHLLPSSPTRPRFSRRPVVPSIIAICTLYRFPQPGRLLRSRSDDVGSLDSRFNSIQSRPGPTRLDSTRPHDFAARRARRSNVD